LLACLILTCSAHAAHTKETFEAAREKLKTEFESVDPFIDEFFLAIEGWYLNPQEQQNEPLVVNIWGPTGNGKTSVVRRAIDLLELKPNSHYLDSGKLVTDFQSELGIEKFMEVEKTVLSLPGSTGEPTDENSIEVDKLVSYEKPVFILDEFQKLRTLDSMGEPIDRIGILQVWELLGNDGILQLSNPAHETLKFIATRESFDERDFFPLGFLPRGDPRNKSEEFHKMVKAIAKYHLPLTPQQLEVSFKGALFIHIGNLNHVFPGSTELNADAVSANELARLTSTISKIDILSALLKIFRPEHVGRLGPNHIRVPTLNEKSLKRCIVHYLNKIASAVTTAKRPIQIEFSNRFINRIYNEGVIPSQGVRPVKGLVSLFSKGPLAAIVRQLPGESATPILIRVDVTPQARQSTWFVQTGENLETFQFEIPSEYIDLFKLHDPNTQAIAAVRQAAATVLFLQSQGALPRSVRTRSRHGNRLGFLETSIVEETPPQLRSELVTQLARHLASVAGEEWVFGEASLPSHDDFSLATVIARTMTANAMGRRRASSLVDLTITERPVPDVEWELQGLLTEGKEEARATLERESAFFKALVQRLLTRTIVKKAEIRELVAEHWIDRPSRAQILGEATRETVCSLRVKNFLEGPNPDRPAPTIGFSTFP
jgi:hypothetical protein